MAALDYPIGIGPTALGRPTPYGIMMMMENCQIFTMQHLPTIKQDEVDHFEWQSFWKWR